MKIIKILQYVISLVHIALQILYFSQWNEKYDAIYRLARIDVASIASANLDLTRMSFHFAFMAILTLAIYVSIALALSTLVAGRNSEDKAE